MKLRQSSAPLQNNLQEHGLERQFLHYPRAKENLWRSSHRQGRPRRRSRKPGPWFTCRKGLRQGDSLSPYLFILVADVLQRMIIQASDDGLLSHPLDNNLPCPVLQYADDTLIILPAVADQLNHLKLLLNQFSEATGLSINFHKSTFAPIHVDPDLSSSLAAILGCPVASFPQSYLGLPLSTSKLNLSAFFFIIDKVDR